MTAKPDKSALVVAFDGMDLELIKEFGCDNLLSMQELGRIDNQSNVSCVKTSELFATFITGKDWRDHGVKGLSRANLRTSFLDTLLPQKLVNRVRGCNRVKKVLETGLKVNELMLYDKTDLQVEAIFDEVDNSKALFVPGYNPSLFWKKNGLGVTMSNVDYEEHDLEYYWDEFEYNRRRRKFMRPVNDWFDFLMVHFHRVDAYQHIYGNPWENPDDYSKLESLYLEMDEFAGSILDKFGSEYDTILFMSDHGLPTEKGHNENAFYSCNSQLFTRLVPDITDFKPVLVDCIDQRGSIGEVSSVEASAP